MQVHPETYAFSHTETHASKSGTVEIKRHTVEVTIKGDRRTVRAYRSCEGTDRENIMIHDLAVRFGHGAKVWPGYATYWVKSGNVNGLRPNIDKRGNFFLIGYFSDFAETEVRSNHNAVA